MQRIVYTSRRHDDTDARGHSADFDAISAIAVERNKARGVTGFLICTPNWYCQILEGRKEQLAELMERIAVDKRHFDIHVLLEQPCSSPSFPLWGMKNDAYSYRTRLAFEQRGLSLTLVPGVEKVDALLSLALTLANETYLGKPA